MTLSPSRSTIGAPTALPIGFAGFSPPASSAARSAAITPPCWTAMAPHSGIATVLTPPVKGAAVIIAFALVPPSP